MKPVDQEGAKKASNRAEPTVIDPYLPNNGNFGYRVSRYELDLEYKVAINRLSGSATITAVTLTELQEFTLDLSDALTVSKVSVNGKRAAHFACHDRKLRIRLHRSSRPGRRCRSSCATAAHRDQSDHCGVTSVSRN